MSFKERLNESFKESQINITQEQAEQFEEYYHILLEWNQKMNLTAITEEKEVIEKHFLDSLLPLSFVTLPDTLSFADVGTGAGFPAIPWLIYQTNWQGVLIDGLNKRIKFLEEVLDKLGLKGIAVHMRGEEAGKNLEYREKFDLVTARAVSNLTSLCEYTVPLVKKNGVFFGLKGAEIDEEVRQSRYIIEEVGGEIQKIEKYSLPEGDRRSLVVIEKVRSTPRKYPRPTAQIKKDEASRKKNTL